VASSACVHPAPSFSSSSIRWWAVREKGIRRPDSSSSTIPARVIPCGWGNGSATRTVDDRRRIWRHAVWTPPGGPGPVAGRCTRRVMLRHAILTRRMAGRRSGPVDPVLYVDNATVRRSVPDTARHATSIVGDRIDGIAAADSTAVTWPQAAALTDQRAICESSSRKSWNQYDGDRIYDGAVIAGVAAVRSGTWQGYTGRRQTIGPRLHRYDGGYL